MTGQVSHKQRLFGYPLLAPILLLLLAFAPFAPSLFTGEILTFRDHSDYFVPMRYYTAERLSSGDLPLWNPYNGSGEKWLANPQTAVFYPPAWLFLVLPFPTAYVLFLAFHVALAGIGAWFLFRRWSEEGAFVGAVIVMLSGPTLSLLDISNNLATFAWIPLAIHVALGRNAVAIRAGVIALMFLGGEPLLAAIGATIYAIVFLATRRFRSGYADLATVAVLAAGLCAAQLIPFLEMLQGSDRVGGLAPDDSLRNSIPPLDWFFTLTSAWRTFPPLPMRQHFIPTLYLGVPAFIFAIAGLWASVKANDARRNVVVASSVSLLAIILFTAAGSIAIAGEVWMKLALNISRYPARFAPFAALCVGLLVAIGVDAVRRLGRVEKVTMLLLTAVALSSAFLRLRPLSFDAQGGRVMVAFVMTAVAALVMFLGRDETRRSRALVLGLVVAVDLIASAHSLFESRRFEPSIAPYDTLVSAKEKILRLTRYDQPFARNRREWLSGYLNLAGKRFDASTPAPVIPAGYLEIHDAALTVPRVDLVDLMSVGALLTDREISHPQFRREARVGRVSLYRNRNAFPMVTTWGAHENVKSDAEGREKVLGGLDVRRRLLLTHGPIADTARDSPHLASKTSFEIAGDGATIEVDTRSRAIVMLNQLSARGWRVFVDGKPATPIVADGLFRAVAVPAGRHRIEWRYEPSFTTIGIAISSIALLTSIVALRFSREKSTREH